MLTFTGLVFTVTMLVLQLASSQLSPRVMRTYLRDRTNQIVLGLFIATFLYALLVLREVRSPVTGVAFVPAIGVSVAFLLLLASVGAFVYYIHHMAQSIRAATVLRSVANETRQTISRLYPQGIAAEPSGPVPQLPERPPDELVRLEGAAGVIAALDGGQLVERAIAHQVCVELPYMVGDFVPTGAPLVRVWRIGATPTGDSAELKDLANAVVLGAERTMTQDTAFGFRQIVDIAVRALSPGTNDPTTAVQALDELHDLLRRIATSEIPSPVRQTDDVSVVLMLPRPDWADYVALALDEIRLYGASSIQIARRLRYLLLDLADAAPPVRRAPIERQLRLLDASVNKHFELSEDRITAASPSVTGQGPAQPPPAST